ncbi:ATP-binding protein [Paraglaciecola sp.]|uniref:ATP-binding protein n=1 Tax=Paraglaciecola sp. TaxID=1920173 RepID=UPI003264B19B
MQSNKQILPTRRIYNKLVANEMMEDFALRFTAKRARIWSLSRIANTALGIVSFLVLEAIGGAITLNFGFANSAWAILSVVFVVFLTGLPISYYAAKYGVDIDLLSRGAGFGYIGSTIASLIYASFTFIFFALEAAIMSMAIQLLFGIPLYLCYVISALVVLPLVTHGIAYISRFQVWTQPFWIVLQLIPLYFVFTHPDSHLQDWLGFTGASGEQGQGFNLLLFGGASAVVLSLVAQIGEQVDFLRFLPEKPKQGQWRWWTALTLAGPGWILFGALKLFLGSFLAYFALTQGVTMDLADDPAHMYNLAFSLVFDNTTLALVLACFFVVISQLKINVANAYAGSLAWSNFFSRVTRNHPGRVVWMVFNVAIALLLMELGIYQTIEKMLSVYSVIVLAWLCTVTADLIINKPLGLSPAYIEFKRSHLYDINPVGVGSMFIATFMGFTAHFGWYGETAKALGSFIACGLPFITVPIIGYITKGRFYLVNNIQVPINQSTKCHICENTFDQEDMSYCPAYQKPICSLCCSLDVRCGDQCRTEGTISRQSLHFFHRFLSTNLLKNMTAPMSQFIALTSSLSVIGASILYLIYLQVPVDDVAVKEVFASTLTKIFFLLLIILGVVSWLFILARSGNRSALKELRSLATALVEESSAHEKTSLALRDAKIEAETANEAKSRYLAGLSHELRTPLNVMLGYAQLLSQDKTFPDQQRETLGIVKRNGEHLADLIEGLLEISKIEAGRLTLHRDDVNLKAILQQLVDMFQMKAAQKNLIFVYLPCPNLPDYVTTDKQRFRQILINLISNAIKYTERGSVTLKISYRNQVASFSVSDTGIGISEHDRESIFKPFEQVRNAHTQAIGGSGLGLTISRSLTELMGGEIKVNSTLGQGSTFNLRLMLVPLNKNKNALENTQAQAVGYLGDRYTVLVVDDEPSQRQLMSDFLTPLGFEVMLAENAKHGFECLEQQAVALVILDVRMPSMDGWQMVKMLRDKGYKMPVLMVSANARDIESHNADKALHDGYIAKPVNLSALLGKVGELIGIQWQYEASDGPKEDTSSSIDNSKITVSNEQYKTLIALAEIGYLSGFKNKFKELSEQYQFPVEVTAQIQEYVALCNFPQIIGYLEELCDE